MSHVRLRSSFLRESLQEQGLCPIDLGKILTVPHLFPVLLLPHSFCNSMHSLPPTFNEEIAFPALIEVDLGECLLQLGDCFCLYCSAVRSVKKLSLGLKQHMEGGPPSH